MLNFFNNYCICLYSKVVYEDAHKQAPRGEIAATRYVSEPQKCVCGGRGGSAPDSAGGAYSAPPDPLAGNGGGPREGKGKRRGLRRGREGWEGEGEGLSPERKSWLRPW